jgi:hypothetical protein
VCTEAAWHAKSSRLSCRHQHPDKNIPEEYLIRLKPFHLIFFFLVSLNITKLGAFQIYFFVIIYIFIFRFYKHRFELVSVVTCLPACFYVCLAFGLPGCLFGQSDSVATFFLRMLACFETYQSPIVPATKPGFLPGWLLGRLLLCHPACLLALVLAVCLSFCPSD